MDMPCGLEANKRPALVSIRCYM